MFGSKDYYILLAEMNKTYGEDVTDDEKRNEGINIEFSSNHKGILFPNLTESLIWTWKNKQPAMNYNQGRYSGYDYE